MNLRRVASVLHVLLVLSGVFVLTMLGVLILRANQLIDHAAVTITNLDRTIIITGAAMTGIQKAEKGQLEQFSATQEQMNSVLISLQNSIEDTNFSINQKVLPRVTMAAGALDDSVQDFRGQTSRLMADAHTNLLLLADSERELNQKIADLDIKTLNSNLSQISEQGITITKNTASFTGHLDKIGADAQQEADKFVAPKTKWEKFKGALGVLWRVAAFAIVKSI